MFALLKGDHHISVKSTCHGNETEVLSQPSRQLLSTLPLEIGVLCFALNFLWHHMIHMVHQEFCIVLFVLRQTCR